jgi:hypothetical protein
MPGILWGPLYFKFDVAWENQVTGAVLTAVLIPCMVLWIFKPRKWTITLAFFGAILWLVSGELGRGIDV